MLSGESPKKWPRRVIRLLGAGVGATVAGPLGAAVGGMLSSIVSDHAAHLIDEYAQLTAEKLSEFAVHYCYDQFRKLEATPPLEAVLREALRASLRDIRLHFGNDVEAFTGWFENWDQALNGSSAFRIELPSEMINCFVSTSGVLNGPEEAINQIFRFTMEALDASARATKSNSLSITGAGHFRSIPPELLRLLTEHLSNILGTRFQESLVIPEHDLAWKTALLELQRRTEIGIGVLLDRTSRILDILEEQLRRAEEDKRIAQEEARGLRVENRDYINKYEKLLEGLSGREPAEKSLEPLLAGDLNEAVRLKMEQIKTRTMDIEKLARDWADLGDMQDLRLDRPEALRCFREAWRLDSKLLYYGFRLAQIGNDLLQFSEAIVVCEDMLSKTREVGQLAGILTVLADSYRQINLVDKAERIYLEALKLLRRLSRSKPPIELDSLAVLLSNLGTLYQITQRPGKAKSAYLESLKIYRKLALSNPQLFRDSVAATQSKLGTLYIATHQTKMAEKVFHEALDIQRDLALTNDLAISPDVAATLVNLAVLYRSSNRLKEAEAHYQEAIDSLRKLSANRPAFLPKLALAINNLANLYRVTDRIEEAEIAHLEALRIRRDVALSVALCGEQPPLSDVAMSANNLGNVYGDMKRWEEGEAVFQEAVMILRGLAVMNPQEYLPRLAMTLNNVARLYRDMDRLVDCEANCREAQAILQPFWENKSAPIRRSYVGNLPQSESLRP
jgi:tetratricopeptide (TPR) repeat protein